MPEAPESLSPELAPRLAEELGLKLDEYEKIVGIQGRVPRDSRRDARTK